MYEIEFSKEAVKHVLVMRKSSPHLFKKLEKLLDELREHPYTGTGHPEQLKFLQGVWSRQLDKKNRVRYIVNETTIVVFIVSALGHYDDKWVGSQIVTNSFFFPSCCFLLLCSSCRSNTKSLLLAQIGKPNSRFEKPLSLIRGFCKTTIRLPLFEFLRGASSGLDFVTDSKCTEKQWQKEAGKERRCWYLRSR